MHASYMDAIWVVQRQWPAFPCVPPKPGNSVHVCPKCTVVALDAVVGVAIAVINTIFNHGPHAFALVGVLLLLLGPFFFSIFPIFGFGMMCVLKL